MFFRKSRPPKQSHWKKVRRLSAYFTILGATLAGFRYHTLSNMPEIPDYAKDNAFFMEQIESLRGANYNTFYLLSAFALFNLLLFLTSVWMLRKEQS